MFERLRALLRVTLRQGTVYYFADTSLLAKSQAPHFFIVVNKAPRADGKVILLVASTKILAVKRRWPTNYDDTCVEITAAEYPDFTQPLSVVDCNKTFLLSVDQVMRKMHRREIRPQIDMPSEILQKLIAAMKNSVVIEQEIQDLL